MQINDLNPWFVQRGFPARAKYPIGALELRRTLFTGSIRAAEFFNPASVMVDKLFEIHFVDEFDKSFGVIQIISPFQYSLFFVDGVPPETTSANSSILNSFIKDTVPMSSKSFNQYVPVYSLAKWSNGLAFKDIHFSSCGIPIIKIAELKNGITSQTQFTNQVFDDSVKLNYDDLLFSWSGNPDTSIDVFRYRQENGWLNQHIFKVEPIGIDKDYLFYLLKSLRSTFAFIASNKQTTGLGHVTVSDLKRLKVYVHSLAEQQHIVDTKCYSSLFKIA